MSSGCLAEQQEKLGCGGKILGRRRLFPPFSPYSRPSSSTAPLPLPPPESQSERRPSWILGVISGAGKLISSVLGSDGSGSLPSECSSDYASEEDDDSSPDEHEDHLLSDDLTGFGMSVDRNVDSVAIVPKSETKFVIQQLLMQETFTRDECNKMIEIIHARVVDIRYSDIGEGSQSKALERVTTRGSLQHLDQNRSFSRASNMSAFSTRRYSHETASPDLRNKAVMEAKKWFEEKKLSPMLVHDQEFGPGTLNTEILLACDCAQQDIRSDGSPIDIAKSYMQSLPPWRSASFSTVGFKTRSLSDEHSFYNTGSNLLPTSKDDKRNYFANGSRDSEKSRAFLKPIVHELVGAHLGRSESPTRLSAFEASWLSPETETNGNKVEERHHKLHAGKAADVGHQMETDVHISEHVILQPIEPLKQSQEVIKDVEVPEQTKEQRCIISASQGLASVAGDPFLEIEILQIENVAPAETSTKENSDDKVIFQANSSLHVNADPGVKHTHSNIDLESSDGSLHILKEANGSAENIEADRHHTEENMNADHVSTSKRDLTATNSNNGGTVVASISEGARKRPSTRGNSRHARKPHNDTKMSKTEPVLTEPAGPSRGKRRVKRVVRQKKWKG